MQSSALVFLSFFCLMAVGYLWRYLPRVPDGGTVRSSIGALVLNILLPALTFKTLYAAPIGNDLWQVPLTSIFVCSISVVISFVAYSLYQRIAPSTSRATIGALILASSWGNVAYLGLPVVSALVGVEYQRIPILFDLLGMTPLLWSFGVVIAVHYGSPDDDRHPILHGIATLRRLPPIYAALMGLLCNVLHLPVHPAFLHACNLASDAVAPLMMISVGIALRWHGLHRLVPAFPALLIKLVVAPVLGITIAQLLGMTDSSLRATIIESAMPTMLLTMVVAERFHLDTDILAFVIAVSTVVSFISVPFFASLV